MNPAEASAAALARLESTLSSAALPEEIAQRGAELLMRLKSPVNLVVIGAPGTGKSRLINMILNAPVIPADLSVPLVEIVGSETDSTRYSAGGQTLTLQDGGLPPEDCVLARIERKLEILRDMNITEVRLSGSPSAQMAAVHRALLRADIVLWCSQDFNAHEQALWSAASDAQKDHSFLVLAKADQLMMKGLMADRMARLEPIVADEFYSLFPVATLQAISARDPRKGMDTAKWEASGGKALLDALRRQMVSGRRADTDSALMYLNRYGAAGSPAEGGPSQAATVPAANAAPAPASVEAGHPLPAAGDDMGVPLEVIPPAFTQALEYLQEQAGRMLTLAGNSAEARKDEILERCSAVANGLVDILMEHDDGTLPPELSALKDDMIEGADMMLLFQLEKTEDAATDAVTLLIQLKREVTAQVTA